MSIYREYDIRGIVSSELTPKRVTKIGVVLASKMKKYGNYVAVGYDARTHSPELFKALSHGLNLGGMSVLSIGMCPTPVNYFCNYHAFDGKLATASVMITGSHNPSEYNGLKITVNQLPFFAKDIEALGVDVEALSDDVIQSVTPDIIDVDAKSAYIDYMVTQFSHLKGLKKRIVYDCGNGVAGTVLPQIFDALALDTTGMYVEPDGTFPNHHPDPSVQENLKDIEALLEKQGDLAFAYDGDADRIAVLTHKYNIKGDQMALLFALNMDKPTIVGEVKCSQVMYDELERRGCKAVMYKTGHSNLKVKMREINADLACEVSGHVFFKERYFGYDDAIYATLRMIELVAKGIDIDAELDALPTVYSTEEIKVQTTEQEKFKIIDALKERLKEQPESLPKIVDMITVDGVRIIFEKGWALVRASNTTPVLVTRFESEDESMAKVYEQRVNALIHEVQKEVRSA